MTRIDKWWWLFLLLAGVFCLAVCSYVPFYSIDRATLANYGRIREGMSEGEVRAILGRESWVESASKAKDIPRSKKLVRVSRWVGKDSYIEIGFDTNDQVQWKIYNSGRESEPDK